MKNGSRKTKLPPFRRLTAIEMRKGMRTFEWTQASVAERFGLGKRTVRRHVNGEAKIDVPLTIVWRLLLDGVISPEQIARAAAGLYPITKRERARRAKTGDVDASAKTAL
jgi:hypothetical protein